MGPNSGGPCPQTPDPKAGQRCFAAARAVHQPLGLTGRTPRRMIQNPLWSTAASCAGPGEGWRADQNPMTDGDAR